MFIVFLFLSIAIYMGLYFAMDYFAHRLDTPTAWLSSFNRMVVQPEETIFLLLRGLILCVALYVVGDFLLSIAKRGLKKKPPPDEMKLKTAVLPPDRNKQ